MARRRDGFGWLSEVFNAGQFGNDGLSIFVPKGTRRVAQIHCAAQTYDGGGAFTPNDYVILAVVAGGGLPPNGTAQPGQYGALTANGGRVVLYTFVRVGQPAALDFGAEAFGSENEDICICAFPSNDGNPKSALVAINLSVIPGPPAEGAAPAFPYALR